MGRYLLITKMEKFNATIDDWYVAEHDTRSKTHDEIAEILAGPYWDVPQGPSKLGDRLLHLEETGELVIEHPRYSSSTYRETLTVIKL